MLKVPSTGNPLHSSVNKEIPNSDVHNWCSYLRRFQEGSRVTLGTKDRLSRDLYSKMLPAYCWDPVSSICHTHHGGVFNLEFSPDGSLLVAACEKKSMLILDPFRGTLINYINNAHNDCVNCIKFLDSRTFASCSDDNSVSLWDIRYLKSRIRSLKGHSNWVKNIEYAHNDGLLVTSGFDGSIYTWDINRYSEGDIQFKRAFHTEGLMRTKISPDGTKLILCSSSGYLMIVHDLDLNSLAKDLKAFKPSVYHHMQRGNTPLHMCCGYNYLFKAKRNRIELISDFPTGNNAEVISSLQVHPQGWCVLSRNTSSDENSEWTCVHDIQDFPDWSQMDEDDDDMEPPDDEQQDDTTGNESLLFDSESESSQGATNDPSADNAARFSRPVVHIRLNCRHRTAPEGGGGGAGGGGSTDGGAGSGEGGAESSSTEPRSDVMDVTLRISSLEAFEAVAATLAAVQANQRNQNTGEGGSQSSGSGTTNRNPTESIRREGRVGDTSSSYSSSTDEDESDNEEGGGDSDTVHLDLRDRLAYFVHGTQMNARRLLMFGAGRRNPLLGSTAQDGPPKATNRKIIRNRSRLTHYVAEPNVGRGFIKELCFSTDGRLVCSPFGHGVRLLGFNSNCSEMCDCVPDRPTKLYELTSSICHPSVAVSTKFSPTHCLLVSGCLNGKICFYQPVLG